MRNYPLGQILPYLDRFSRSLILDIESGEILNLIKHLDLRKCTFDEKYYPRAYMVLTSFGLIAEQYAIKLNHDHVDFDEDYLGFILNPIFIKERE